MKTLRIRIKANGKATIDEMAPGDLEGLKEFRRIFPDMPPGGIKIYPMTRETDHNGDTIVTIYVETGKP